MEKPDNCPECGSEHLTKGAIDVTAQLVQTFNQRGEVVEGLPPMRLEMRVGAWHCEDCDHDEIDKKRVEAEIAAETDKMLKRYIAEMN